MHHCWKNKHIITPCDPRYHRSSRWKNSLGEVASTEWLGEHPAESLKNIQLNRSQISQEGDLFKNWHLFWRFGKENKGIYRKLEIADALLSVGLLWHKYHSALNIFRNCKFGHLQEPRPKHQRWILWAETHWIHLAETCCH